MTEYVMIFDSTDVFVGTKDEMFEEAKIHAFEMFECDPDQATNGVTDFIKVIPMLPEYECELPLKDWFEEWETENKAERARLEKLQDNEYKLYLRLRAHFEPDKG